MYSQPLIDAIAEAEQLVAAAPFIESEADLLEGLQYLAAASRHARTWRSTTSATIRSCTAARPFTKMGLDNPDTLYFGTRVRPATSTS